MQTKTRFLIMTAAPIALAAALVGCTSPAPSPTKTTTVSTTTSSPSAEVEFNASDVMFATMMIPHHQQAVEMSNLVLNKDGVDAAVVELAETIKGAQAPEIDLMSSWLTEWGQPLPDGMDMEMDGMDMGMDDGMMSDDMAALESAGGAEASTLFLEQMIAHHEGAIAMAEAEIENGTNPDAVTLATAIVAAQTAEIELMKGLLSAS